MEARAPILSWDPVAMRGHVQKVDWAFSKPSIGQRRFQAAHEQSLGQEERERLGLVADISAMRLGNYMHLGYLVIWRGRTAEF